jgi:hypothetical protein
VIFAVDKNLVIEVVLVVTCSCPDKMCEEWRGEKQGFIRAKISMIMRNISGFHLLILLIDWTLAN